MQPSRLFCLYLSLFLTLMCVLNACGRQNDPLVSTSEIFTQADSNIAALHPLIPSTTNAPTEQTTTQADSTTRVALPPVSYNVNDPQNTHKLPTARISHSYGAAKGGLPHSISVESQAFFEKKPYRAYTLGQQSGEKILYLTFDCGWENGYTTKVLDVLEEKKVPAAFFATLQHIKSEPELIARMIAQGHIVGNHSSRHPDFSKISRTEMAKELEDCENYLRSHFNYSSSYFRFPEGVYTENALELVQSLGFTSVFWSLSWADWDVTKTKGEAYAFDIITERLHPGAIILLHSVSPDNAAALGDIIDYARSQGYIFHSLDQLPKTNV